VFRVGMMDQNILDIGKILKHMVMGD